MNTRIVLGDITTFDGDALLNAANPQMLGGGGVDGAVHRAAGPNLKVACRAVPGVRHDYEPGGADFAEGAYRPGDEPYVTLRCPVGQVRPVPATGTALSVGWVINTVGPILNPQRAGALRVGEVVVPDEIAATTMLFTLYVRAIEMARLLGLKSLAVPAVSTGVYGVPHAVCAEAFMCAMHSQRKRLTLDVTVYLHGLGKGDLGAWYAAAKEHGIELKD